MKPEKIASFTVDHNKLKEGIYISRTDGDIVTYDLRTRRPNQGDYMDNLTMHSVEHMIATYIRSSSIGESIIYFGPMGCQTGFYLLVKDEEPINVLNVLKETLEKDYQEFMTAEKAACMAALFSDEQNVFEAAMKLLCQD